MRSLVAVMVLAAFPQIAFAAPLATADRAVVTSLPDRLATGWLHNSQSEVMSLFAPEAVFIPHDGVRPKIGKPAIDQFWFPPGGAAGTVTGFTMTADSVSGQGNHAIVWGKSDLRWQDDTTAYHWLGYYLIAAERRSGKWLVTHLMSSDEQPTSQPVEKP